jgi:hypothetical protein
MRVSKGMVIALAMVAALAVGAGTASAAVRTVRIRVMGMT